MSIRPTEQNFHQAIHEALTLWDKFTDPAKHDLTTMLLVKEQMAQKVPMPSTQRLAINEVLLAGINHLKERQVELADVLVSRFLDGQTMKGSALQLHTTPDRIKHLQRDAIAVLSRHLWGNELMLRHERQQQLLSRLPQPTYSQLFEHQRGNHVYEVLSDSEHSQVVMTIGIGGIGKTALADFVTRRLLREAVFREVVWVRVDEGEFSAEWLINQLWQQLFEKRVVDAVEQIAQLRIHFGEVKTLIVVDNIESEQQLSITLGCLEPHLETAKLMLTSRYKPPSRSNCFVYQVEQLSQPAALQLANHHAKEIGFVEFAELSDKRFGDIYQAVGGNPLALKLLVGLAEELPLKVVLADFSQAKIKDVEALFLKIYWYTWETLEDSARQLLEVAVLASGGMQVQQMQAVCGLDERDFWQALRALLRRALLETSPQLENRTYRLHQLTRSFMQTEIIQVGHG